MAESSESLSESTSGCVGSGSEMTECKLLNNHYKERYYSQFKNSPSGLLIEAALAGELVFLGLLKEGPLLLVVELVVVEIP